MSADKLITASVMLMTAIFLIACAALFSPLLMQIDDDGVRGCFPTYPGGAGTWVFDPADSSCWYIHTDAEFDAFSETCAACHDGVSAAEW